MRTVITDADVEVNGGDMIIKEDGMIHGCRGCFSCWFRTPGMCGIVDGYRNTGKKLSMSDELIIISRCLFGGYSPFVKNVIDRSISYVQPFFDISEGDMRHKERYNNKLKVKAVFYGDVDENSKETAKKLVTANARNLRAEIGEIAFFDNIDEIGGMLI